MSPSTSTPTPASASASASTPAPDTHVPSEESPADRCPYCGRPFRDERACALHVGEAHPDDRTPADEEAYERAREDESEELFTYHMKVIVVLGAVQIVLVVLYLIAFG